MSKFFKDQLHDVRDGAAICFEMAPQVQDFGASHPMKFCIITDCKCENSRGLRRGWVTQADEPVAESHVGSIIAPAGGFSRVTLGCQCRSSPQILTHSVRPAARIQEAPTNLERF